MTALGAAANRNVKDWGQAGSYPVLAAAQIWKGGLVTVDANGYAIAATDTADTWVVGVATESVLGGTASGDKWVKVEAGRAFLFAATSITQAMVGDPMYVVDDNTVDDAAGATNEVMVGLLVQYVSNTSGWVYVAPTFSLGQIVGVTASAGEINYLDITGAGTAQASKAVVLGASKEIAELGNVGITGTTTVTSASATSLAVGRLGATTPAFTVDSSTGSQVGGLKVTGSATGGTTAVVCTDSGADNSLTIDAKGAGTIKLGNTSTGAVTIKPATTITGILTPTGGIGSPVANTKVLKPTGVHTCCQPAFASTVGTDTSNTNTEAYCGAINIAGNCSTTGVSVFNGTAVAGNIKIYLFNSDGTAALAATASTAQAGTDAYQRIAWAGGPISLVGPATYYIVWTGDTTGATQKVNQINFGEGPAWKETGLVYGTCATITPVTTFTADRAPYATLY